MRISAVPNERGLISRAQGYQSVLQGETYSINQMVLPVGNNVSRVQRNRVELVGLIDTELVAGALDVIPIPVDAEVFDQKAVLQRKIRVPSPQLAVIHDGRWFLVNEWNPAFCQ